MAVEKQGRYPSEPTNAHGSFAKCPAHIHQSFGFYRFLSSHVSLVFQHPIITLIHIFQKIKIEYPNSLLEASIDAAILVSSHSPPMAMGVEQCTCPSEYNGTSCQDPSNGYYRWREFNSSTISDENNLVELVGRSKPCQCNGRSDVCHLETGHCLVSIRLIVISIIPITHLYIYSYYSSSHDNPIV